MIDVEGVSDGERDGERDDRESLRVCTEDLALRYESAGLAAAALRIERDASPATLASSLRALAQWLVEECSRRLATDGQITTTAVHSLAVMARGWLSLLVVLIASQAATDEQLDSAPRLCAPSDGPPHAPVAPRADPACAAWLEVVAELAHDYDDHELALATLHAKRATLGEGPLSIAERLYAVLGELERLPGSSHEMIDDGATTPDASLGRIEATLYRALADGWGHFARARESVTDVARGRTRDDR